MRPMPVLARSNRPPFSDCPEQAEPFLRSLCRRVATHHRRLTFRVFHWLLHWRLRVCARACALPFFTSGDLQMRLSINRLGSSAGVARCMYSTFDMSAIAGKHYIAIPPTWVEFKQGENSKDVYVDVIPCSSFDGTVECGLYIDESNAVGAAVGKYLHTCTIKIIDTSVFPSDSLKDLCRGGDKAMIKEVSPGALIWGFITLCWSLPVTRLGTKRVILAHQYNSLFALLTIYVILYIVETLTDPEMSSTEKKELLALYAALWVVPFAGVHYLAYRKCFWKVGGSLRKQFSVLLLKKFLNYTDNSRNQVAIEQLLMAMVRDVTAAWADGYVAFIDLVFGALLKIVYLILSMIYLQTKDGGEINLLPLLLIFSMPIFISIFLGARQKLTFELKSKFFVADDKAIGHAIMSVVNYPLIADYDRRTFQLQRFEAKVNASNGAMVLFNASSVNSAFFAPWLTTLFVGVWIMYGGYQVVDDPSLLALFLSTISIFRGIGGEVKER